MPSEPGLPAPDGTLAELLPISEQVLAWVAHTRANPFTVSVDDPELRSPRLDDLRRVELMALAVREACFRNLLYPEPVDLSEADRAVLREHAPAPFNPLKGATCDCGAPATWWMDNMSGYMVFGCDAHRPYQQID